MNGRDAFDKAVKMLGYNDDFGIMNEAEINRRMGVVVNAVYADLYFNLFNVDAKKSDFCEMNDMLEDIPLPSNVLNDCFVYGVCMWLAQSMGDSENQRFFTNLYEYKRLDYLKKANESFDRLLINDVMP